MIIKLSDGHITQIDKEDFERVSKYNWWYHASGYAYRQVTSGRTKTSRGKVKNIMLHRFIMDTPDGMDTDHINRDKLDNRKSNLRIVNRTQNNFNIGLRSNNTSGYKGVHWFKPAKLWRAYIGGSKNRKELGYFKDIKDAIKARKEAEREFVI